MDCIVHGVAKSQTQLSNFHFHFPKNLSRLDEELSLYKISKGKEGPWGLTEKNTYLGTELHCG